MKRYQVYWTTYYTFGVGKPDLVCEAATPRAALSQWFDKFGMPNLRAHAEETEIGIDFYVPKMRGDRNVLVREWKRKDGKLGK